MSKRSSKDVVNGAVKTVGEPGMCYTTEGRDG